MALIGIPIDPDHGPDRGLIRIPIGILTLVLK